MPRPRVLRLLLLKSRGFCGGTIHPVRRPIQNIGNEMGEGQPNSEWYRANHQMLSVAEPWEVDFRLVYAVVHFEYWKGLGTRLPNQLKSNGLK